MRWLRRVAGWGALLTAVSGGLVAQESIEGPSIDGQPAPLLAGQNLAAAPGPVILTRSAAERALELGFPAVAATLYGELAGSGQLKADEMEAMRLDWLTALIEAGKTEQAATVLAGSEAPEAPRMRLRRGLLALVTGDLAVAREISANLAEATLPGAEKAWAQYLKGALADQAGDEQEAAKAFAAAAAGAGSNLQRARFELADLQTRLQRGDVTTAQATALRQNVERYQGRGVGYDYAKQYAAVLSALRRSDEAVTFLQRQLQSLPAAEAQVRDDFNLLLGLIAGPADAVGRNALTNLLARGQDEGKQRVALQLLVRATGDANSRDRLRQSLARLIAEPTAHPIEEDLRLVRAQLALADNLYDVAEGDARVILERFPGSELRAAALGVLVGVDWERGRFRAAAANAAAARTDLPPGQTRAELGVLLAEAFFRAGDYRSAADGFAASLAEVPAGVPAGRLMYQQVLAEILAGRLDEAGRALDAMASDPRFDAVSRWQAEWNLARALQAANQVGEALARVDRLLAEPLNGSLPAELQVQLAWLQARLALTHSEPSRALTLIAALRPKLENAEGGLRADVASSLALLEAEANFDLDRPEVALAGLRQLREAFPRSDAAVYSYIVEADAYVARNQLVEAQQLLTRLADDFPDHHYASFALFEAALNAERRGQEAFYREAYTLLERLVQRYPRSPLLFQARLKQGDLLRQLNEFALAQQTYEWLINNLGQHRDVLRAQLALADCHAAQAAADASHQESANAIYERLRDLPTAPTPLRIEAGFKLGYALWRRGGEAAERGRAVWWQLVSTFLVDRPPEAQLRDRGRYWMSRILLELGSSYEQGAALERAQDAYRLIVESGLPGTDIARSRLARFTGGAAAPIVDAPK